MSQYENNMGAEISDMIGHANRYATAYKREFDTSIGSDGVLGPEFAAILSGLHGLLNGPLGRCDGGTLSRQIHELAKWAECLDENGELP